MWGLIHYRVNTDVCAFCGILDFVRPARILRGERLYYLKAGGARHHESFRGAELVGKHVVNQALFDFSGGLGGLARGQRELPIPPATLAAAATATEDFRNSRREVLRIGILLRKLQFVILPATSCSGIFHPPGELGFPLTDGVLVVYGEQAMQFFSCGGLADPTAYHPLPPKGVEGLGTLISGPDLNRATGNCTESLEGPGFSRDKKLFPPPGCLSPIQP